MLELDKELDLGKSTGANIPWIAECKFILAISKKNNEFLFGDDMGLSFS